MKKIITEHVYKSKTKEEREENLKKLIQAYITYTEKGEQEK